MAALKRIFLKFPFLVLPVMLWVMLCGFLFTQPEVKPELMEETGLVVATFSSNKSLGMLRTKAGDAKISGETYRNAVRDNHLLIQLKPGKYKLENITGKTQGMSAGSGYSGKVYTTATYNLSIDFDVEAGKVTNIGAVVVYLADSEGKKGNIFYVKNDRDVKGYLKSNYPELYSKLKYKDFLSSSASYLSSEQIVYLRRSIIASLSGIERNHDYTATVLGTLCRINRNAQGKVAGLDFIETDTYEPIKRSAYHQNRFVCAVPNGEDGYLLYAIENHELSKKPLLNFNDEKVLALVGDRGVVISDLRLSIQTSIDNGSTWEVHDQALLDKPISYSPTAHDYLYHNIFRSYDSIGLYDGRSGYYIFSKGSDSTLLYRDYKRSLEFKKISPPESKYRYRGLIETKDGLFTFPDNSEWSASSFFFLPVGSLEWVKRECPSRGCSQLISKGDTIAVQCFNNFWESVDAGINWESVAKRR